MASKLIPDSIKRTLPWHELLDRKTGLTTAKALEYVSLAIRNPNTDIKVTDHHHSAPADRHCLMVCREIIGKLGLQYFKINVGNNTIRSEHME